MYQVFGAHVESISGGFGSFLFIKRREAKRQGNIGNIGNIGNVKISNLTQIDCNQEQYVRKLRHVH